MYICDSSQPLESCICILSYLNLNSQKVYLACTARLDVTGGVTRRVLREHLPKAQAFLEELFGPQDRALYDVGCPCGTCFRSRPLPR
jgi:hypothetical protein